MKNLLKINKVTITIMSAIVVICVVALVITLNLNKQTSTQPVTKTSEISTFHPTYSSTREMLKDEALDAVFTGTILNDGKPFIEKRESPAPPFVNTEYEVRASKVIKGDKLGDEVTISVIGGIYEDTRYYIDGEQSLSKGDKVIVFASKGDDGKYYPLSAGTAVAKQVSDDKFKLPSATISDNTNQVFKESEAVK